MKILYTSDIHAHKWHLASMLALAEQDKVDAVIIGGDLIPHGLPRVKQSGILKAQATYLNDILIPSIRDFRGKYETAFYLDMGNDDFIAGRALLEAQDGELFHLLHMRKHPLSEGVDIIGYMAVPPTPFSIKDWEKPDSRRQPYSKGGIVNLDGYLSRTGEIRETHMALDVDDRERSIHTIEKHIPALHFHIPLPPL
jgi:Icc-related predicted phosphoesterase